MIGLLLSVVTPSINQSVTYLLKILQMNLSYIF